MVSSSTSVQAANTRARAGSGAGTSLRSSQAVSIVAARKSSDDTSARRKPVLVVMPRIAVSPRASARTSIASSRVGAQAMTLPSIGS